ncbi:MAG: PAS domain S-box protein [Magnetovibrionaceae bacterium]
MRLFNPDPRLLWVRYALAIVLIFAFVTLSHVSMKYALVKSEAFAEAIDLSGRQRMLSQRIMFFASQYNRTDPRYQVSRDQLKTAIDEFEAAHLRLTGKGREEPMVELTDELSRTYFGSGRTENLHADSLQFIAWARLVLDNADQDGQALRLLTQSASGPLLVKLNEAVQGYERFAHSIVEDVEGIASFGYALAILVLGLVILLIFYPAHRLVVRSISSLEDSEKKFKSIIESSPDPLIVVDSSGTIQMVNDRVEEVLGYTASDLIDGPVEVLLPRQIRERHVHLRDSFFLDPKVRSMGEGQSLAAQKKDGKIVLVEVSLSPISVNGSSWVAASIRDISERKRMEQALGKEVSERKKAMADLAQREAELRTALENMPNGLMMLDADLRVQMVNERYSRIYQEPPDVHAIGRPIEDVIRDIAGRHFADPEKRVKQSMEDIRSRRDFRSYRHLKDGRILSHQLRPIEDGGVVIVIEDITERKKSELQLKDAYGVISDSIVYASRIQSSILSDMSKLEPVLEDSFVLWEPRDIVGGDIYWCDFWGDGILIVLADCTGHGVPGAFLSLLATGALDKARSETFDGDLQSLIAKFHSILQRMLCQDQPGGHSSDGLELGACYIEPSMERLYFVGARFDLFVADGEDVTALRGNRNGLGHRGLDAHQFFDAHEVLLTEGRRFYLCSDGITDQIGGERQRGFGKKRLLKTLQSVQGLPMSDQKNAILQVLIDYQGDQMRRDDLSMIGFQVR